MKTLSIILLPLLAVAGSSLAQTTIIGGTLRNGDFNKEQVDETSTDSIPFERTDFWENAAGTNQGLECTRTNIQVDGTRAAVIRDGLGDRAPGQDTEYDVVAGDSFNVKYSWRDAFSWTDDADQISVTLYTTEDDTIGGVPANEKVLLSGLSTANNSWADVDQTVFFPEAAGKRLFVIIDGDSGDAGTGGYARVDNFELIVTAASAEAELAIDSGDYEFGELVHLEASDSTARIVTFRNAGGADLTLDSISLSDDGGGVYSITSAPAAATVIGSSETFDVEVTATGGGGGATLFGEVLISTTPDSQDTTVPVSAAIQTTGDPFNLVQNPFFEPGIEGWEGEGIASTGLSSPTGIFLEGFTEISTFVGNVGQTLSATASDMDLKVSFAIPDFLSYTGDDPVGANNDRSFQLALTRFPGTNFVNNPVNQNNVLVSLFYFPAGNQDSASEGWYVFEGDGTTGSFVHLPALGTLMPSAGPYADPNPPANPNVYELDLEVRGFGTDEANYTFNLAGPGIDGSNTSGPLTAFYNTANASPTVWPVATVAVTTNDYAPGSFTNPDETSFDMVPSSIWVDTFQATLLETLPVSIAEQVNGLSPITVAPNDSNLGSFVITNTGIGGVLEVNAANFETGTNFTLDSPALPVSIPAGSTQEFVVRASGSGTSDGEIFTDTLTLESNDVFGNDIVVSAEGRTISNAQRILIDFDDGNAGNGIHDMSVRNGGFEDIVEGVPAVGDDIFKVAPWTNLSATEGIGIQAFFDTNPASGSFHSAASGFVQPPNSDRLQPTQAFTTTDWVLQEGHVLEFQVDVILDGNSTDGGVGCIADCINDGGNTVADPVNGQVSPTRILSNNQGAGLNGETYTRITFVSDPIQRNSPWIGNTFSFRFNHSGLRTEYRFIDNVRVIARAPLTEVEPSLTLTDFDFDFTNNMVTLRWLDTMVDYQIEVSSDLDYSTDVTTIDADPLDLSVEGEAAFTFPFDFSAERESFFRVIEVEDP